MSKPLFLSSFVLLVLLNQGYASEAPAFKSKLFESGNLLISDDFDQGKYKGRYGPNKKNVKQLADGTLEVLPLSGTPGDLTIFISIMCPQNLSAILDISRFAALPMPEPGYRLAGIKCISVVLVMGTVCF